MVERHKFKPLPKTNVEDRSSIAPVVAQADTKNRATSSFPLFLGAVCIFLSLIPVCIGIYEFEVVQKRSNLPLASFDAVFRKAGTFFPFVPLLFRCFVQIQNKDEGQGGLPWFFNRIPSAVLHVGIQAVRLALYRLHVLGQQQGVVEGDLVADHCVLGVAVQTALSFEIAASMYLISISAADAMTAVANMLSASSAWVLLVVLSFDMRDTAKYFHEADESLLGVALAVVVFALPTCYLLLTPVLQRLQSAARNGKKGS
eukprot:jgi/Ulvmu1/11237/UM073_0009.1